MTAFIHDDFLLSNEPARKLYHEYAKDLPIIDFHCHLSPQEIAENKRFRNITDLWLGGDHYKWRAMRANGIEEDYITGHQDDFSKFKAWAQTLGYCLGNPLFHWTQLELKRYFGIDEILTEDNAREIYDRVNQMLAQEEFTAQGLINQSNVEVICTTDDLNDDLRFHEQIAKDGNVKAKVLPTMRPDKALNINQAGFLTWLHALEEITGQKVNSFDDLVRAIRQRVDFFHDHGCRLSDHGLARPVYRKASKEQLDKILQRALQGKKIGSKNVERYQTALLQALAKMYVEKDWCMQIHTGAIRNNNSRMFKQLGPDTGYDSIGDGPVAEKLSCFLDSLDKKNNLPRTILYNLNPADNSVFATMIANFQSGTIPGKIQFGSGWWFLDQKYGMEDQMRTLALQGLLRRFVGMVTDSRSFTSYPRHEYFRRTLANLLGQWVAEGQVPEDYQLLGKMVQEICHDNAARYFKFS